MEVSDYLSISQENYLILGWSVLHLTTFFFVLVVILVFQLPEKHHYNH